MRTKLIFAAVMAALGCALFAAPAQAQRARVFVASYGSDSNPCTFGSPCKTFQQAVDVVAAGGEVTAIDSAGFGPVTISQAVTITSPNGVEAGIAANPNGYAIIVAAGSSDVVVLSGLTLEGAQSGDDGILFETGAELEVVNCAVRNYLHYGIFVSASAAVSVLISNTIVSDNADSNIYLATTGSGSLVAALNQVTVNNSTTGITTYLEGGPLEASIANSHIDNNSNIGIFSIAPSGSATSNLILNNVTLNQTPQGIYLQQYTNVWLSNVTQQAGSGLGTVGVVFYTGAGGNNAAYSDGTNHLMGGVTGGTLGTWTPQ
jgi:hypothetical protein